MKNIISSLKNSSIFKVKNDPLNFKIQLALCVHRGIDPNTVQNVIKAGLCKHPDVYLKIKHGDALISRSRSVVATSFLDTDYDVLIFVDDDIIFNPMDIIKLGLRCNEQKYDIIGGAYLAKTNKNPFFVYKSLIGDSKDRKFCKGEGEPFEVENVSTGFMAIRREVLQTISKELPLCNEHINTTSKMYPFFDPFPKQNPDGSWIHLSEDWAFTTRARKLGFKVWIDPSIKLGHAGRYVYGWGDLLKQNEDVDSIVYRRTDFPADSESAGGPSEGAKENQNGR